VNFRKKRLKRNTFYATVLTGRITAIDCLSVRLSVRQVRGGTP